MRLTLPINPQSTSPLREVIVFAVLTIFVTWLFWMPGALLPMGSAIGDFLVAVGMLVPLAVAIFLQVWLQKWTFAPLQWFKTLTARGVIVAVLVPVVIFVPVIMLRTYQGTLDYGALFDTARDKWASLIGLLLLAVAEESGWRAYCLPRLKTLALYLTNLFVGLLWFVWQMPLVLAARYNESEDWNRFFIAMFLFALLITPFLNRVAMRADYNPILSAITRAGLSFIVAIYFLQGRADPLSDTFGSLTIVWLVILNLILFSQLWRGKKPPAEISELERVMPMEIGN